MDNKFTTPWEEGEATGFRMGGQQYDGSDYPYNQPDLDFREGHRGPHLPTDGELKKRIYEYLNHEAFVDDHHIEVKVFEGQATFSGRVKDHWMKLQIEALAEQIPGVRKVVNNLEVDPNPDHYEDPTGELWT